MQQHLDLVAEHDRRAKTLVVTVAKADKQIAAQEMQEAAIRVLVFGKSVSVASQDGEGVQIR